MIKVVNALIINEDKFLVIKRKEGIHKGKWAFPGGIVNQNETDEQALKREIIEEIGLEIKRIIKTISEYSYKRENDEETKGKSYLVQVKDFEIIINKDEIEELRWVTLEEFEKIEHIENLEEEMLKALYE